jgi:hypothetical protein
LYCLLLYCLLSPLFFVSAISTGDLDFQTNKRWRLDKLERIAVAKNMM